MSEYFNIDITIKRDEKLTAPISVNIYKLIQESICFAKINKNFWIEDLNHIIRITHHKKHVEIQYILLNFGLSVLIKLYLKAEDKVLLFNLIRIDPHMINGLFIFNTNILSNNTVTFNLMDKGYTTTKELFDQISNEMQISSLKEELYEPENN